MASLGKDLATIRKQRQYSLDDLHNATKIPRHILQAIEDDSIFTEFSENKTYIRSYIRSYAKALKLEDERVVEALNKFEEEQYEGQLLQREDIAAEEEQAAFSVSETREQNMETDEVAVEEDGDEGADEEVNDMVHDHIPDAPREKPLAPAGTEEGVPEPPSIDSVDWADMGRKFTPLQTKSRMWIGIVVILIIVAAVVFFWIYQNNPDLLSSDQLSPDNTQNLTQPGVVPDSLQLNLTNDRESSPNGSFTENTGADAAAQTLPDTLTMLIYAAYGKLEPVRVYTDVMGELNPYWIENGEAYRFEFVNVIRIRGQYSRMEMLVNGHPIQNFRQRFYQPDTSMVVIERSLFENDDRWLEPPPSSSELGFLPPSIVQDRPRFN
ncbi:MAG: helix-turn-helix domain-containing protein [Balneolaceae bacterium]|nr:helix-turn-helix domain-containing protein [Balneolaceae bacterium]